MRRGWTWLVCALIALVPVFARADVVDVHDPALRDRALGPDVEALLDDSEGLTLEDVLRPRYAAQFARPEGGQLNFGYRSSGALWVRFRVRNAGREAVPWYLELAYPLTDRVTLYVPDGRGGFTRREAGDKLPFSARELPRTNFVFALDEPAASTRTYYMRVQTQGVLLVPLAAWGEQALLGHGYLMRALVFAFYGASVAIVLYHAWLYALTRLPEHGLFALAALTGCFGHFCHSGYAFQYLWPNNPLFAEQAVFPAMALGFFCNGLFMRCHTHQEYVPRFIQRAVDWGVGYIGVMAIATAFIPHYRAALLLAASMVTLVVACIIGSIHLRLHRRRMPTFSQGWVDMLMLGWLAIFIGLVLNNLMLAGHLPRNLLTAWGLEFGVVVQLLLVSTGLAGRVKWLKAELAGVNDALTGELAALDNAVQLAEAETERSRAAARAKDEFVATMSHELRTPLNAIINVPPAIVQDIVEDERVRCSACEAHFGLEPDEKFDPRMRCPDCRSAQTLALTQVPVFVGDAKQTLRHLALIERSGRHLLYVVRGILEPSATLERTRLQLAELDAGGVVRDVTEELSALAMSSGVRVALDVPSVAPRVVADPDRLRQVLINLLGNALKFSDGKGTVTVSVSERGDTCVFSVRDQGIGIARDKQAQIFETFEQTGERAASKFRGTGLGLSIARSLVRLHGGNIWVESELGQGACFFFSLPRAQLPDRPLLSA